MHPLMWALVVVGIVAVLGCVVVLYACCCAAAKCDRRAGYDCAIARADEEEELRYGA